MPIVTSLLPSIDAPERPAALAVVIDVLRATSAITTALGAGAREVVTCREIDQARQLAAGDDSVPLLCGERACRPIPGFDLGNSPAEYLRERVLDRRLIFTTTNGTRAIESCASAEAMVLASFLNLSAIARRMAVCLGDGQTVHIVCAGTDGRITGEDSLLAGALIDRVGGSGVQICDPSRLVRHAWRSIATDSDSGGQSAADGLVEALRESLGGRNLTDRGFSDDIARCAVIDQTDCVAERVSKDPARFVSQ